MSAEVSVCRMEGSIGCNRLPLSLSRLTTGQGVGASIATGQRKRQRREGNLIRKKRVAITLVVCTSGAEQRARRQWHTAARHHRGETPQPQDTPSPPARHPDAKLPRESCPRRPLISFEYRVTGNAWRTQPEQAPRLVRRRGLCGWVGTSMRRCSPVEYDQDRDAG